MTLAAKLEDIRHFALQEGRAEGEAKGRAEGARDAKIQLAKRLLQKNFPLEEVAEVCVLDLDEVKKIAEES